jgi:hypothetical protein
LGQSPFRKLTLTPPLNRGEEAGYMIIISRGTSEWDPLASWGRGRRKAQVDLARGYPYADVQRPSRQSPQS